MVNILTPGPTRVRENVRLARSLETTNPDLDIEFYDFYKETCDKLSEFFNTDKPFFILSGEGILGLEAACASLTEPGDRVLVIDNGIFGEGFADFVRIYGGTPVMHSTDRLNPVDAAALRACLEKDSEYKYATLVHCDTPSGVLNDAEAICKLLKEFGILTVVDSVSAMFGEPLSAENIDILCGGSQKALSAPPGITMLCVSNEAFAAMEARKTPIASFYANILGFKDYYKNKWFPYTMPASDIYGLRAAIDNAAGDALLFERHRKIAAATRAALTAGGLELHIKSGYSSTVTVFNVPDGISCSDILSRVRKDYNIMLAGCFGELADKVIRIGHMGEGADKYAVGLALEAVGSVLEGLGVKVKCSMRDAFFEALDK